MPGEHCDRSRRCGLEHHPNVVGVSDAPEQRKASTNIRTPTNDDFSHGKVVNRNLGEPGWIDPVPRNQFGSLAGEDVGLVLVVGSRSLVEQLADSVDQ
jgi:hypothetical protein